MDAQEFLTKYANGERNFQRAKLAGFDLRSVDLIGVDLTNANLTGTIFKGADLSKAIFTGAKIHKADFTAAILREANLYQVRGEGKVEHYHSRGGGTYYNNAHANFNKANLCQTNLSESSLNYCIFTNADLDKTNFKNASLCRTNLENTSLFEADLSQATLDSANLTKANLVGADLSRASLNSVKFQEVNLQGAKLKGVNLTGMDLSELNLENVDFTGATLENINLRKACLRGANLARASLCKADLMNADFTKANLQKADLTDAKTYGTIFEEVDFTRAIMPDGEIYFSEVGEVDSKIVYNQQKQVIFTELAPKLKGLNSQGISADGKLIFINGQIGIDLRVNDILYPDDFQRQTEQMMANIQAILNAAGASFQDVVETKVYLTDMQNFSAFEAVYGKYFDYVSAPTRACLQIAQLPQNALVAMDCVAVI
ncbi:MAG: endoribonuclease L-PSP [Kamptonema sp. SIO1D9]|nr:endoribonuclease L-PSP [Kamptonema sp. SIO1D9]